MSNPNLPPHSRKNNVRLALILASAALVFFVGFIVKIAFFPHP
jgi:uncharacterized membrane protein (DUF485 family)